jgi:hypothetical protein
MGGRGTGGARAGRDKEQAEAIIMGFSFSVLEIIRFFIFFFIFCFFVFVWLLRWLIGWA